MMLLPTQDKNLINEIHIVAKELCQKHIGIGCPFNYDCQKRECCIDDAENIAKLIETLGYHKGLPTSIEEALNSGDGR